MKAGAADSDENQEVAAASDESEMKEGEEEGGDRLARLKKDLLEAVASTRRSGGWKLWKASRRRSSVNNTEERKLALWYTVFYKVCASSGRDCDES